MLKTQRIVGLFIVVLSRQIDCSEYQVISTLEPPLIHVMMFFDREDGYKHALLEKISLFDEVDYIEAPRSFLLVPASEEEPIVVSVSIQVVFDKQVVLQLRDVGVHIGPADIAALEVGINTFLTLVEQLHLHLQLLKRLPVVVDEQVDAFEFAEEGLAVIAVGGQFVIDAFVFLPGEVLFKRKILTIGNPQFLTIVGDLSYGLQLGCVEYVLEEVEGAI